MPKIDVNVGRVEGHGDVGKELHLFGAGVSASGDQDAAKADVEAGGLHGVARFFADEAAEASQGLAREGAAGFGEDFVFGESDSIGSVVGGIPAVVAGALEAVDGDEDGCWLRDDGDIPHSTREGGERLGKGNGFAGEADEFATDRKAVGALGDEVAVGEGGGVDVGPSGEDEADGVGGLFLLDVAGEEAGARGVKGMDFDGVDSGLTLGGADGCSG